MGDEKRGGLKVTEAERKKEMRKEKNGTKRKRKREEKMEASQMKGAGYA